VQYGAGPAVATDRIAPTTAKAEPTIPSKLTQLRHHDVMSVPAQDQIRPATPADAAQLVCLWALLFDEDVAAQVSTWAQPAHEWFARAVRDPTLVRIPVIEIDGEVVATAIGTLELGVPNPHCRQGRTVRLSNLVTVPEYRGRGYGTLLVRDVIEWAHSIDADRVDLSATADGQRIYERVGFSLTQAPRMKLVL
jgi:ribosomal protein S18 acetylase RimI-like enzyme